MGAGQRGSIASCSIRRPSHGRQGAPWKDFRWASSCSDVREAASPRGAATMHKLIKGTAQTRGRLPCFRPSPSSIETSSRATNGGAMRRNIVVWLETGTTLPWKSRQTALFFLFMTERTWMAAGCELGGLYYERERGWFARMDRSKRHRVSPWVFVKLFKALVTAFLFLKKKKERGWLCNDLRHRSPVS